MLKIDTEKMMICLTRGDTANIVFSAIDDTGTTYVAQPNDVLRFSVAKKVGADPLFDPITRIMGNDPSEEDEFWTITIQPAHTNNLKFGDYVFDVQLTRYNGGDPQVDTIIGTTDEVQPIFRVWGEVSPED